MVRPTRGIESVAVCNSFGQAAMDLTHTCMLLVLHRALTAREIFRNNDPNITDHIINSTTVNNSTRSGWTSPGGLATSTTLSTIFQS